MVFNFTNQKPKLPRTRNIGKIKKKHMHEMNFFKKLQFLLNIMKTNYKFTKLTEECL